MCSRLLSANSPLQSFDAEVSCLFNGLHEHEVPLCNLLASDTCSWQPACSICLKTSEADRLGANSANGSPALLGIDGSPCGIWKYWKEGSLEGTVFVHVLVFLSPPDKSMPAARSVYCP